MTLSFNAVSNISYAILLVMIKSPFFLIYIYIYNGTGGVVAQFHSCYAGIITRNGYPHSSFFVSPNRWKAEGAIYRLYHGCGRTVLSKLSMCTMAFKLIWCVILSYCKRMVAFSSGLKFCTYSAIQLHTFALYALLCQTPFCLTAPLLPRVTQQEKVMEYWWEFNIHCHNVNILLCPCMPI